MSTRWLPLRRPHLDTVTHPQAGKLFSNSVLVRSGARVAPLLHRCRSGAGAECLCDVTQSSLLGFTNLHASDTEETAFL